MFRSIVRFFGFSGGIRTGSEWLLEREVDDPITAYYHGDQESQPSYRQNAAKRFTHHRDSILNKKYKGLYPRCQFTGLYSA